MHLAIFLRLGLALVLCLAMSACSDDNPQSTPVPDDSAKPVKPGVRQKTFLDPQLKAIDKAKSVEQLLKKDAANTDKAIDDSGG